MIPLVSVGGETVFGAGSFSWTRNGTHFDVEKDSKVTMKPGSGTLVIDISSGRVEAYEGVYQCTARNEHGTAVSNNIVIRQSSKSPPPQPSPHLSPSL